MTDISMDARVLVTCFFANGEKNSLKIGGVGAQSVFSDRAESAIKELVLGGFVTASEFNSFGRMGMWGPTNAWMLGSPSKRWPSTAGGVRLSQIQIGRSHDQTHLHDRPR